MAFNARDLAMLLPDEVDVVSMRFNNKSTAEETPEFQPLQPKVDKSRKVTRYFPQQVPAWVEPTADNSQASTPSDSMVSGGEVKDKRLERLARVSTIESSSSSGGRRKRYEAEVIVELDQNEAELDRVLGAAATTNYSIQDNTEDAEDADEVEEEDIATRRARSRSKMAEVSVPEELSCVFQSKVPPGAPESESSEYETDSDDEEEEQVLLKPVFVPRAKRETILEQERRQAEEEALREKKTQQLEERKKQTRVLVAESVRRLDEKREADTTDADSDAGLPDDTDDPEDAEAFELWRVRELTRLKRDIDAKMTLEMDRAETLRRRNMTAEQRKKEDERLAKDKPVVQKEKWNFLQKYYHKGVFYMDEASLKKDANDVRRQAFSEPTLEDKIDKEKLPAILQVKKFGMRGRTKYTHLVDQDTTRFDRGAGVVKPDRYLQNKYLSKVGGLGDLDSAGRVHKKQKL